MYNITRIIKRILILVLSIIIWLVLGEVVLNLYFKYREKNNLNYTCRDKKYGWRATPNFEFKGFKKDKNGNDYYVHYTTDERGFRYYDIKEQNNNKKIFFIGDSFTQAIEVSNDKTFFGILKQKLKCRIYAGGVQGYNTIQEFLLYEEFKNKIQPDLIIWQLCYNDILNNLWELEIDCYAGNNNIIARPYYENGEIKLRYPKKYEILGKISFFLYYVIARIELFVHKNKENIIEQKIKSDGENHNRFISAVSATEKIIKLINKKKTTEQIIFFSVDDNEPYYTALKKICKNEGCLFIESIPMAIRNAEANGKVVFSEDGGHWAEEGHRICTEEIYKFLIEKKIFEN